MKFALSLLVLVSNYVFLVVGSPFGAPLIACDTMTPLHNTTTQTTQAPFATVPQQTTLQQGQTLTLRLMSNNPAVDSFRGYLVEAFDSASPDGDKIGTFSNPSDGQILDCPNQPGIQNAATHTNNLDKTMVTLDWIPPTGFTGSVFFKTTFVQIASTFWVKTTSSTVTVA